MSDRIRGKNAHQRVHVGHAVFQDLLPLFRRERPALHNPLSHGVLALGVDGVQPVVAQQPDQPFAFRCGTAIGQIAECRTQVQDVLRHRPPQRQVAGYFGVGDEVDEKHPVVGAVRRLRAEFVAPQLDRPPAAQFTRGQADDVGTFSRPRDELEIVQPDFVERQLTYRCHGRPTSEKADAPCCRAIGPCRERRA